MKKVWITGNEAFICFLFMSMLSMNAAGDTNSHILFDSEIVPNTVNIETIDAKGYISRTTLRNVIRVETGTGVLWPGITLKAPDEKWDLSDYEYVTIVVKNVGSGKLMVACRLESPGYEDWIVGGIDYIGELSAYTFVVNPDELKTLTVPLYTTPWRFTEQFEFIGMRGAPGPVFHVYPSNVTGIIVHADRPDTDHTFEIYSIRAGGSILTRDIKNFFPMVDEFGQYIHKDWPGKTHSLEELLAHKKVEEDDLTENPGSTDRNKYGGWTGRPRLKATGFFRVEKYRGKWWMVDPEGRLFWSHGMDCVNTGSSTPISDREHWFHELPGKDTEYGKFYRTSKRAAVNGYYRYHFPYELYDWGKSNMLRKYGENWEDVFIELAHRRLKSWGMNTIGNWSDENVYLQRKTPYTDNIRSGGRVIEGSVGFWGKFPDPFDRSFRQSINEQMERKKGTTIGDPWCIGYFVGNELAWGDEISLAIATLKSPPDQPAKRKFIEHLKARYKAIDNINAAWGTGYASWNDLLQSQNPPDEKRARADLTEFYSMLADEYFSIYRDEIKRAAPHQLFLGSRFSDCIMNDLAVKAAAKKCDVITINIYRFTPEGFPQDIDTPVLIGEYHFGALDRGLFDTGLRKTENQCDRARAYQNFVRNALSNPLIVGTHWFQYRDQPLTGRSDSENYQIGFVDICDTPYREIVSTCREVGYSMYEYRLNCKL